MTEIIITFEGVSLHQVRNFGETLYRACTEDKWAETSIDEADRATDRLRVTVNAKRRVRRAVKMVEKLLERELLASRASVSVASA